MASMVIDSLQAFKALQASGFTEAQAQAVVSTIQQIDMSSLATKGDIAELRAEARETALTLQLRLGGMIVALGGVLVAVKYFGN